MKLVDMFKCRCNILRSTMILLDGGSVYWTLAERLRGI